MKSLDQIKERKGEENYVLVIPYCTSIKIRHAWDQSYRL